MCNFMGSAKLIQISTLTLSFNQTKPVFVMRCLCSGSQGESNEITPEFIGKMVYS